MAALRCSAKRANGTPCKGWRKPGSIYCRIHLINPVAKAKAEMRAHVMSMGFGDFDVDVDEIALKLVAMGVNRVAMLAAEYESLVAQVGLHAATVGETTVVDAEGSTHDGKEYIRGLADADFRERKLLIDLVFKAKAANLGERQIQLAERTGLVMAAVLKEFLSDPDLALSPAQRAMFPAIARRVLGLETATISIGSAITVNSED